MAIYDTSSSARTEIVTDFHRNMTMNPFEISQIGNIRHYLCGINAMLSLPTIRDRETRDRLFEP